MPTVNVKKDLLMDRLGVQYSDEEFEELCFKFGIELDDITSEKQMAINEKSATGQESDDVIYKIDIPANRYDLLSLEGLVLALRIFNEQMKPPEYRIHKSSVEFLVDEHAKAVRPVLLGAIVRNVNFTEDIYNSFIDLQDKIHQNIGRKRSMVSIGTHDLDTVHGPFLYTAMDPNKLSFVPLNQSKKFTATELMEFYADSHLKTYLPLIKDKPEYPVIMDKNKTVLSMPPIINGDVSKITLKTKNVLIEVTATDRAKATIALDTIISMLVSSNGTFEAESVKIKHSDGQEYVTPDMSYYRETVDKKYINRGLGLNLTSQEIANLLTKMSLKATALSGGDSDLIEVHVPPTRHDIIHKCDIMEDVGIAYGYDNICKTLPKSATISNQVPLNNISDQLRNEIARCGYTEALNFALCSEEDLSSKLRRKLSNVVKIQNPKTKEFQVARTCLLAGLLNTIQSNKKMPLPLKLFEISDVVFADPQRDVGARNERHLAAVYHGKQNSGFEIIHGLLDRIMQVLECQYIGDKPDKESLTEGYYIQAMDESAYFPGRCAAVIYNSQRIGHLGTLHPEVLKNFDLNHPSSALEIDIERLALGQMHR